MSAPPYVSVVVPIYNESGVIDELCRRIHAALQPVDPAYEIILVDDGSSDDTRERARAQHARDPRVKLVVLSRNFGHQVALSAGLDRATGQATIMMDGDLQDPPELLPGLIAKWREGWDVVYAVKRSRRESLPVRLVFRAFHAVLHRVADIDVPMGAGNLSLLSERVVRVLRAMPERARYLSGLRAWVGFSQIGVEFDREERWDKRPRMTFGRLFRLAFDAIFGFSRMPLRAALWIGLVLSVVSLGVGLWVLYERLFTQNAVVGWSSILVSINFIGGAVLLTLGVIGEYIARIYDEVKSRPLYLVREEVGIGREVAPEPRG